MRLRLILAVASTALLIPLSLAVVVTTIIAPQALASCAVYSAVLPSGVTIAGVTDLTGEQIGNARIIIGIASSRGLSLRDAKIALMVAMQESRLVNLTYGSDDSLGLFQQRPSQGWGTPEQIMDPVYATNKFFDALTAIKDRNQVSLLEVALRVQHPDAAAYRETFESWEPIANELLQASTFVTAEKTTSVETSTTTTTTTPSVETAVSPRTEFETPCTSTDTGVPGQVIIAPGANNPGEPVTQETLSFLAQVAGIYGKELVCTTGTNHSYLTVDGTVSDHASGHACDFGMTANGGSDDSPVGDAIARACLIAAGDAPLLAAEEAAGGGLFTRVNNGLRIQCIWKTDIGGNHHNHVHIGAVPIQPG